MKKDAAPSRSIGAVPLAILLLLSAVASAQQTRPATQPVPRPGQRVERLGDEIMVCGQLFHTGGAPVILWTDPGGYDSYRVERRFSPYDVSGWEATRKARPTLKLPNRFNLRESMLTPDQIEQVRGGGWDLKLLQETVDQFVIHYDACGVSKVCFDVLHDHRGLSVHFMLDLDGAIYQCLDLKERAWHATTSNSRCVGIEIAHIGAYSDPDHERFGQWYAKEDDGRLRLTIPQRLGDGGIRTAGFIGRPARDELIAGVVQGRVRYQYDFTPQQYDSLVKLTATLCTVLPKIKCDYPRDEQGNLLLEKLSDDRLKDYAGILGHHHIQTDKIDPGPAFQWDTLITQARSLMTEPGQSTPADSQSPKP